jgi:hypothetical protein
MTTQALSRTEMYIQISRVHRRRFAINDSLLQDEYDTNLETNPETEEMTVIAETVCSELKPAVNWLDFWKRARVYPEQLTAYPDASNHTSSRHRRREFQRARANAYVSDTDDDTQSDTDVIVN